MTSSQHGQGSPRTLSRILFPVDFSDKARTAASHVRALSTRFRAPVTLMHALTVPHYEFGWGMLGDLFPNRLDLANQELNGFAAREFADLDWTKVVAAGDAASLIVDYARHERVDLVVMPTHGMGTFRQFLLGSTTAKVLHDAECPVLTGVHLKDSGHVDPPIEPKFQNILCAVDLRPNSERVLRWAADLARAFESRLFVVHALPSILGQDYQDLRDTYSNELVRNATAELQVLTLRVAPEAVPIVTGGEVTTAVVRQVRELSAELVVIGRGATGGLFGRLRSNAYELIRESPAPVVSV